MPKSLPCLSDVRFGSFLVYSPHGVSAESKRTAEATYAIKNARGVILHSVTERLAQELRPGGRAECLIGMFGENTLLVPCPRSAPLYPGALWPAKEICDEFVRQGIARESASLLERISPVTKSSTAIPANRPKAADHVRSMRVVVDAGFVLPQIVVVDDVVTRGATLLAAASHIKHAFPDSEVRVFAVVRRGEGEIAHMLDPLVGEITLKGQDTARRP